uniref:Uncharacterized protein n=1 Tax=Anguilla anguilla TaxID=7936 RepID=A0A0E9XRI3_ANGAN
MFFCKMSECVAATAGQNDVIVWVLATS